MPPAPPSRWLLLIHQIPPQPSYLRVKVGRRLQALGAVAVKNSVYVLPRRDATLEDFQWVRREIASEKGEATVCEARFVEGLSDAAVKELFRTPRQADYALLARDARRLQGAAARPGKRSAATRARTAAAVRRLRKRLEEVVTVDFFAAPGREAVEGVLAALEAGLRPPAEEPEAATIKTAAVRGRTWVTRTGVQVDRIASAWLIRRFVDPRARFKFVRGPEYAVRRGELRFDMFEAEFTHQGEQCTFEVLRSRFGLEDPALRTLAEIVHDIDLKDARFGRPEAPGLDRLLAGISLRHRKDETRLREGAAAFDALYESFGRKG